MVINNTQETIPLDIIKVVFEHTKISYEMMKSKCRKREYVEARYIAMSLIRKHTTLNFKRIGLIFGGFDHSTIIHACDTIQDLIFSSKDFRNQYEKIERDFMIRSKRTPHHVILNEMRQINLIRKYNHIPSYQLADMIVNNKVK